MLRFHFYLFSSGDGHPTVKTSVVIGDSINKGEPSDFDINGVNTQWDRSAPEAP